MFDINDDLRKIENTNFFLKWELTISMMIELF